LLAQHPVSGQRQLVDGTRMDPPLAVLTMRVVDTKGDLRARLELSDGIRPTRRSLWLTLTPA